MKTYKQREREKYIQSTQVVNKGFRTKTKTREEIIRERERIRYEQELERREEEYTWWKMPIYLKERDSSVFKYGDLVMVNGSMRGTVNGFQEDSEIIQIKSECGYLHTTHESQLTKIVKKQLSPEMLEIINKIDPYGEDIWDE